MEDDNTNQTDEIILETSDIKTITCQNGNIILNVHKNDFCCEMQIDKMTFKSIFPQIAYIPSINKYCFVSHDQKTFIDFDPQNKEIIETTGTLLDQLTNFEVATKNTKYHEIVKAAGFDKEYCLVFAGNIMFHSPSKEEMYSYKNEHPYFAYTEYHPHI
jgi:hypothetical protein